MTSKNKTLIFWTAEWCAPCKVMKKNQIPEKLAKELGVQLEYRDCDLHQKEADALQIWSIPTIELREETKPNGALGKLMLQWKGAASLRSLVMFFKKGVEQ